MVTSRMSQVSSKTSQLLFTLVILSVLITTILVPFPVQAAASRYYVKASATGLESGLSWATATSLQSAIDKASAGSDIWVAQGTYYPSRMTAAPDPRSATFRLEKGVRIYGGFAGNETLLTARDWVANPTILSGDIGVASQATDNAYHVVTISASTTNAATRLDGFTIRDGRADGPGEILGSGGGIAADHAMGIYQNLTFLNNTASYAGGGLSSGYGSMILIDSTFEHNHASKGGGLFDINSQAMQYNNVHFINNSVTVNVNFTDTGDGGGLRLENSNSVLTGIDILNNSAQETGGGISVWKGNPSVTGALISGNSARRGGGLFVGPAGDPTIQNVTFLNNSATTSGGGAENFDSSAHYENVVFNQNHVLNNALPGFGGAMEIYNCRRDLSGQVLGCPTILNSIFSSNTADNLGGAILSEENADPILTNVLFYNNSATNGGGAIYSRTLSNPVITNATFYGNRVINGTGIEGGAVAAYQTGTPIISNSILWGNTPVQIWTNSAVSVNYSLIQGGYAGTGNLSGNPLFIDPAALNFQLMGSSPAIDAGNNAAVPAGVTVDLAGKPRYTDMPNKVDTGVGTGSIVDMGAYEMQPPDLRATFTIDKTVVDEGGTVTITVRIENQGEGSATNVTVTDVLPPVFARTGVPVITTNPVTSGTVGSGSVIAENIRLDHGGIATVTYSLRALDGVVPPVPTTNPVSVSASEWGVPITTNLNITINNLNPHVEVTGPFQADPFTTLNFHGTITDPGQLDTITNYVWDFGDGTPPITSGMDQAHSYANTGIFIVRLTATDKDGGVGVGSLAVFVAKYFQYFPFSLQKGKYK